MVQLSLPSYQENESIVNVASVPQRSPFRYPGGKTWLVPHIRKWLISRPTKPSELIEPFAGGAIVGLTVAFENLAQVVTLVELDDEVAALWKTILAGDVEWLTHRITTFDVNPESVQVELVKTNLDKKDKAFQTLLRNRVNHGGIMAPGSGVIKYGENGKGIKSRWYPDTLKKRILRIVAIKDRIRFIEGDGLEVLKENAQRSDAVFFIDPPYTAAGKKAGTRLYRHHKLDHEELFRIAETLTGDFLMTYDNTEDVQILAQRHGFDTRAIPMKNTHHAKMTELLISRNLDWAREEFSVESTN
ncbi:MAG: DNA adenine methylase [Dehalococcoidia bacterium]|nr:DNA adenine methylase [Dehalococcoidia bacterium]